MGHYIIGITGASGSLYAEKTISHLLDLGHHVHICITDAGKMVTGSEIGWGIAQQTEADLVEKQLQKFFQNSEQIHYYDNRAIGSAIASGSFPVDGMAVVPCSMGTLSSICHGSSGNLLERAADVCIKERRRLVIVPREAPYNRIHLENMLRLSDCGAVIMPASPGFYAGPKDINELVDFFAVRLLDQLGIHEKSTKRWAGIDECTSTG